jgi:membrane protein required for colicin V production
MDILLLILLGVGFVSGLFSGAVKQLVSLVAFAVGFVIACLYYQELAKVLTGFLSMPTLCEVVAFILLWVIVPLVANLVGSLVSSLMNHLPVIGLLNRLLGGIICLAKYALVLGTLIWFFSSIKLLKEETMEKSRLCKPLKALPEYVYKTLKAPSLPCDAEKEEGLR